MIITVYQTISTTMEKLGVKTTKSLDFRYRKTWVLR